MAFKSSWNSGKNQSNRFDFMKSSSKLRKRPRDSVMNLCDRKNSWNQSMKNCELYVHDRQSFLFWRLKKDFRSMQLAQWAKDQKYFSNLQNGNNRRFSFLILSISEQKLPLLQCPEQLTFSPGKRNLIKTLVIYQLYWFMNWQEIFLNHLAKKKCNAKPEIYLIDWTLFEMNKIKCCEPNLITNTYCAAIIELSPTRLLV